MPTLTSLHSHRFFQLPFCHGSVLFSLLSARKTQASAMLRNTSSTLIFPHLGETMLLQTPAALACGMRIASPSESMAEKLQRSLSASAHDGLVGM